MGIDRFLEVISNCVPRKRRRAGRDETRHRDSKDGQFRGRATVALLHGQVFHADTRASDSRSATKVAAVEGIQPFDCALRSFRIVGPMNTTLSASGVSADVLNRRLSVMAGGGRGFKPYFRNRGKKGDQ